MEIKYRHAWPSTKHDAIALQKEFIPRIALNSNSGEPSLIAAVDSAYGYGGEYLYAAAVVLSFPNLQEVERVYHSERVSFQYYPGLFYFREGPTIVGALAKLKSDPDFLMIHGHGIAHPQYCGIACHVGVAFNKPSLGCARRILAGTHHAVNDSKGSYQILRLRGKPVGFAYRTKDRVKPLFISPGHQCDMDQSRELVVKCLRGFRLPEPLRLAHLFANKYKRKAEKESRGRD